MRIDDQVEPLVRQALDSAVHRDISRFETSLGYFSDEESSSKAIELVLSVSAFVLFDVYDGKPLPSQIDQLAERISRQESWLQVTADEASTALLAVTSGDPSKLSELASRAAVVVFVIAANLLASASRPNQGEWWFNYLDRVEAAIEAGG